MLVSLIGIIVVALFGLFVLAAGREIGGRLGDKRLADFTLDDVASLLYFLGILVAWISGLVGLVFHFIN